MSSAKMVSAEPQILLGTRVCVRYGVADPDFPNLPIEGWTGTIVRINGKKENPFLVRWDSNTLENAGPDCRSLCEENDLVFEEMWLAEDDLSVN